MSNDPTAYAMFRLEAQRGPVSTPQTPTALRFLLTAWLIDDNTHWTPMHEALAAHLKNRAWMPSAEDYQIFYHGLMAWAAQYEMTGLVERAMGNAHSGMC